MRILIISFISYFLTIYSVYSDMKIIKNGKILESKPYSINEATLIVSLSEKIYICSVSNSITKCILSKKRNAIN
ncbi:MAG: hypothetical protein CMJ06_00035 [Pelagibacterales bacterium]|nr:hypothetical protein [Pelagibacterales bacterium]